MEDLTVPRFLMKYVKAMLDKVLQVSCRYLSRFLCYRENQGGAESPSALRRGARGKALGFEMLTRAALKS